MWLAFTYKRRTKYFIRHVNDYKHGAGTKFLRYIDNSNVVGIGAAYN